MSGGDDSPEIPVPNALQRFHCLREVLLIFLTFFVDLSIISLVTVNFCFSLRLFKKALERVCLDGVNSVWLRLIVKKRLLIDDLCADYR